MPDYDFDGNTTASVAAPMHIQRAACLTVCANAHDANDASMLLAMLGSAISDVVGVMTPSRRIRQAWPVKWQPSDEELDAGRVSPADAAAQGVRLHVIAGTVFTARDVLATIPPRHEATLGVVRAAIQKAIRAGDVVRAGTRTDGHTTEVEYSCPVPKN